MSKAWKDLQLEGGGLQAINTSIVRLMRHRRTAYGLWFVFPLGLHRLYLKSKIGFLIYIGLTQIVFFTGISESKIGLGAAIIGFSFAMFDLIWIDRRVTRMNKELRMRAYLQPDHQPPENFRGRYTENNEQSLDDYLSEKSNEIPADRRTGQLNEKSTSRKVLSFADQEKLLKEIRQRSKTNDQ